MLGAIKMNKHNQMMLREILAKKGQPISTKEHIQEKYRISLREGSFHLDDIAKYSPPDGVRDNSKPTIDIINVTDSTVYILYAYLIGDTESKKELETLKRLTLSLYKKHLEPSKNEWGGENPLSGFRMSSTVCYGAGVLELNYLPKNKEDKLPIVIEGINKIYREIQQSMKQG